MQGKQVSQNLVARIMRKKNLRSVRVGIFKQTTNSKHTYAIVENRLAQNFSTSGNNQVRVSDITYIKTDEDWVYLTTVIDLFDRKVLGWQSNNMRACDTVIPALNKACSISSRTPDAELIFHSDGGIQYACNQFKDMLRKHKGILQSMSGKGNCYDSAVTDSFFKTIKSELIYQNRYKLRVEAYYSVFEYIEGFYNTNRRHSHWGYLTIKEFNKQHKFKQLKIVAGSILNELLVTAYRSLMNKQAKSDQLKFS